MRNSTVSLFVYKTTNKTFWDYFSEHFAVVCQYFFWGYCISDQLYHNRLHRDHPYYLSTFYS